MKIDAMLRLLARDGWELKRTRGSHRQFVHPTKAGKITVAGKPSDNIKPKTEASILRQAGLQKNGVAADVSEEEAP